MRRPRRARWAPLLALLLAVSAARPCRAPRRPCNHPGAVPAARSSASNHWRRARRHPRRDRPQVHRCRGQRPLGHPVARQYLAPDAAGSWSDEAGIAVLSPDYATVATEAGSVTLTASPVGTVDERGVFTVAGNGVFTRQFTLEQVDGEWRITDPPDGLIILRAGLRAALRRPGRLLPRPTRQRVVPDPRLLIKGDAQPTALVHG